MSEPSFPHPSPPVTRTGRFAPTPSGRLHFGSLIAAVGSYLHVKAPGAHPQGNAEAVAGRWLVRIEDLDPPRTQPGAADAILRTLEAHGLHWDGPSSVWTQSTRGPVYFAALERLARLGVVYGCACSRKTMAEHSPGPGAGGELIYGRTCLGLRPPTVLQASQASSAEPLRPPGHLAQRLWTEGPRVESQVCFEDGLQGPVEQNVSRAVGDFVLWRADGVFAYHLAVVVDDAAQGVSEVVRGSDLLDCTPRQILLQRLMGLPTPHYVHLPVAVNAAGEKLSKQTLAMPLDNSQASANLCAVLTFLSHPPPAELWGAPVAEVLAWAVAHWELRTLPRGQMAKPVPCDASGEPLF